MLPVHWVSVPIPGQWRVQLVSRRTSRSGRVTVTPCRHDMYTLFLESTSEPTLTDQPCQSTTGTFHYWCTSYESNTHPGQLLYRGPGEAEERVIRDVWVMGQLAFETRQAQRPSIGSLAGPDMLRTFCRHQPSSDLLKSNPIELIRNGGDPSVAGTAMFLKKQQSPSEPPAYVDWSVIAAKFTAEDRHVQSAHMGQVLEGATMMAIRTSPQTVDFVWKENQESNVGSSQTTMQHALFSLSHIMYLDLLS